MKRSERLRNPEVAKVAARLRAAMPVESTIDIAEHARLVAEAVVHARHESLSVGYPPAKMLDDLNPRRKENTDG